MRTVSPAISFVAGAMVRSSSSPSESSTTGVATLCSRPAVPVGKLSFAMCRSFERRFCGCLRALGDPLRDELGVFLHPADERGAARVLPGQAEEVEAGDVRDAAPVDEFAVGARDGQVDPGVVERVTRRPDDGGDVECRAVLEDDRPPGRANGPRLHPDAGTLGGARARADEDVTGAQPPPKLRIHTLLEDAELAEPPEEIPSGDPLRERRL